MTTTRGKGTGVAPPLPHDILDSQEAREIFVLPGTLTPVGPTGEATR